MEYVSMSVGFFTSVPRCAAVLLLGIGNASAQDLHHAAIIDCSFINEDASKSYLSHCSFYDHPNLPKVGHPHCTTSSTFKSVSTTLEPFVIDFENEKITWTTKIGKAIDAKTGQPAHIAEHQDEYRILNAQRVMETNYYKREGPLLVPHQHESLHIVFGGKPYTYSMYITSFDFKAMLFRPHMHGADAWAMTVDFGSCSVRR